MRNEREMSEVQKAAEWVRHARANHVIYWDSSSQSELNDALKSLEDARNKALDKEIGK
jgi:hypothetical protein